MSAQTQFDPQYLDRCSFCRKTRAEVHKLIAAETGISICDECVGLCNDIIAEERAKAAETLPPARIAPRGLRGWLRRVF